MNHRTFIVAACVLCAALFPITPIYAQGDVPAEAQAVVSLPLETAQAKLTESGYEIAHSSLMGKEQWWWQESSSTCVCLKFAGGKQKPIKEVTRIASADCEKGVEAARKVWEAYSDGPAPVHSAKLDAERQKLTDQGYTVSYWAKELCSCGNSSEYWYNAAADKCAFIVFVTTSGELVRADKCEASQGKNPAPPKQQ